MIYTKNICFKDENLIENSELRKIHDLIDYCHLKKYEYEINFNIKKYNDLKTSNSKLITHFLDSSLQESTVIDMGNIELGINNNKSFNRFKFEKEIVSNIESNNNSLLNWWKSNKNYKSLKEKYSQRNLKLNEKIFSMDNITSVNNKIMNKDGLFCKNIFTNDYIIERNNNFMYVPAKIMSEQNRAFEDQYKQQNLKMEFKKK